MRMREFPIVFTRLVTALGLSVLAAGTAGAAEVVEATVPFGFHAGKADLPAGRYRVEINRGVGMLTIQDLGSAGTVPAMYETTLSQGAHEDSLGARMVFERTDDGGYSLSEVWLPEGGGILVGAAKGKHEHRFIAAK